MICWFGEGKILLTLHISLFPLYVAYRQDEVGGAEGGRNGKEQSTALRTQISQKGHDTYLFQTFSEELSSHLVVEEGHTGFCTFSYFPTKVSINQQL